MYEEKKTHFRFKSDITSKGNSIKGIYAAGIYEKVRNMKYLYIEKATTINRESIMKTYLDHINK